MTPRAITNPSPATRSPYAPALVPGSAPSSRTARGRRAVVLLMCLVVITIGALVGTTILYFSGAQSKAAQVGLRTTQSRAMAWSGVQAAMAQLAAQREQLLQGAAPSLTEYWVAGGEDSTESSAAAASRWGFRVLQIRAAGGASEGDAAGAWLPCQAEMGKIDVNTVPKEVLSKLPGVTESLADAIIAARASRRFTSVPELLRVPGMTPSLLFEGAPPTPNPTSAGPAADPSTNDPAATPSIPDEDADLPPPPIAKNREPLAADSEQPSLDESPVAESASTTRIPLCELVTVFSFDPEVQLGFGPKASEARGNQRINLNVEWSEDLGSAIERRFDRSVADGVKNLLQSGRKFEKPSDIVKTLRSFQIKPDAWPEVLDAFTTTADDYRFGQLDLTTASEAALTCIPGITPTAAREIVFRRGRLDEERKRTAVWPVLEGIMTEDEFEKAVNHITARCLQWRVIIEGGIVPSRDEASWDGGGGGGAAGGGTRWEGSSVESAPLDAAEFTRQVDRRDVAKTRERIVLEAVIDVSSLRPRVAMLRDVTHVALARRLGADVKAALPDESEAADTAATPEPLKKPSAADTAARENAGHDLDLDGLELDDLEPTETSTPPDISSPSEGQPDKDTSRGSTTPAGSSADPRVGRWTTGGQGGKP